MIEVKDGLLYITNQTNKANINNEGLIDIPYIKPKYETTKYKVNKDGLFEEVKDNITK